MLLSIAWKNIWRNKVRSMIVIFAVVFGMFGGIFASAVLVGMSEQRLRRALDVEIPHIRIQNQDFSTNKEVKYMLNNVDSIIEVLIKNKEVISVSKHYLLTAMASTAKTGAGVMVYGIDPEKERIIAGLYKTIADSCGKYLSSSKKNTILIGKKLANKLNAKVKSKIVLTLQSADGVLTGGAFKVAGIFETKNTAFDEMNVYVLNSDLMVLANLNPSNTHEITIKLKDKDLIGNFLPKIKRQLKNTEILSWKEIQPELAMLNDMMNIMLYIIIGIILLALGFGIVNTMLMVVLERVRELGMLMAVGMNRLRVFTMIMLETVFLTLTGGIIGIAFTIGLVEYYGKKGMNLQSIGGGYESFGWDSFIYPTLQADFYIVIAIMVLITGVLASVYPAIKALKLRPVEAIRMENLLIETKQEP